MFIDLTNIDVGVSPRAVWSLERCRNKWLQIAQHIFMCDAILMICRCENRRLHCKQSEAVR